MPTLSTNNTNTIYKYKCMITTLFKDLGDKQVVFENMRIRSITIDYNYKKNLFPLIYCTIAMKDEEQDIMTDHMEFGTVQFRLQKFIANSSMPGLLVDYINEECVYFISADLNKGREIPIDDREVPDVITIGFIALKHINAIKKTFNGIVKGSMSAILFNMLNKQNVLMEPLTYNKSVESLIIPPRDSAYKTIEFLNNYSAFYDTPFRFFMDFDTTYLISSSGKGVPKKGEMSNIVKIIVHNKYQEIEFDGIKIDRANKMYILDIYSQDAKFNESEFVDKLANQISGVSTTGNEESVKIANKNKNSQIKDQTGMIRVPNGNTNLLKNMQSNSLDSNISLSFHRNTTDGAIYTINKQYVVEANDAYGDYFNGRYLLSDKKEIFAQEGSNLTSSILLIFNKKNQLEG